ncbi:MAG TPA: acyl-CoA dehydrogenase family protein [Stellaceae bacterium]|nr:acyl-CoA dehydrogenase family protein [Stellaceae bacterium]
MADRGYLAWPFFEDRHRALAASLDDWAAQSLDEEAQASVDDHCRALARALGAGGWLRHAVPEDGGALDGRTLCLIRETLARHRALADFAFAMQGLGTATITLFGSAAQRARWLPAARAGTSLAAFALSEPDAGSDVAALATTARKVAGGWRLDGCKTWISNGGIAGHYVVFARSDEGARGTRGISAFIVPADAPGLAIAERIEVIAPHPLARLAFDGCRVGDDALIGAAGDGFKLAMATLDVFRPSVGAAALGLARRAYDEALARARTRQMFGAPMAELQLVQAKLADMATAIDASALLVYRAAWARDVEARRITREAAMAKLYATEAAQRVIDDAVQIFGGLGVRSGSTVEALYREIRALRIYEGASEVQKIIIARQEIGR